MGWAVKPHGQAVPWTGGLGSRTRSFKRMEPHQRRHLKKFLWQWPAHAVAASMGLRDLPTMKNFTRWGGRTGRYAEFRGAVSRCYDPISQQHVQFAYAYEYEAWLHARFDPDTASITVKATPVVAEVEGRICKAVATFVVTSRSTGANRLHLACKTEERSRSRVNALKRVGRALDAQIVVTTLAQVRSNVDAFWRMELLRQAGAIHEDEGLELDARIAAALGTHGDTDRGRLVTALGVSPQLVDARLAWMHCHGLLRLDLSQDNYGVLRTQVVLQ